MTTVRLPLFPLNSVLYPGLVLPLHIFEERYRAMVSDALRGDRTIGMAMWKPKPDPIPDVEKGANPPNPPNPPIYPVGGAGEIVESEELEDGRFNIVLQARFRRDCLSLNPGRTSAASTPRGCSVTVSRDRAPRGRHRRA